MQNQSGTDLKISDTDTNIDIKQTDCDATIKLDAAELERTLRISDEELQKTLQESNDSQKNDTTKFFRNSTTGFFSLSKTSNLTSIFERKRNIDDELKTQENITTIGSDHIKHDDTEKINLHSIEDSFNILGKIGEGGQGTISSAADRSLGRIVALKSLHKELSENPSTRAHFISEAKITAQLDYPGIVPIYSLNTDENNGLHLAMKFINGETLAEYLERIRKQYSSDGINKFDENHSIRKRIDIFLRSCDAVSYAHSRNVMHCDLKPENIMLGQYNDSYIMDWGIARLIHDPDYDPLTWKKPTSISGTPRYLAPEILEGIYADERADIYALGLILFECVFLKCAYNGKSTKEVIAKIKNNQMETFKHAFHFNVNKDLCAIIRKAVAPDRDSRYQSAAELADDIRAYLANEETIARPDNMFTKMFRFAQHHIKTLLICTVLALLLGGASVTYSIYRRNQEQYNISQREIAISEAYSKALYVASMIELQFNHVSNVLKTISAYISFLLEHTPRNQQTVKKYFFVPDEENLPEYAQDIRFSLACNKLITLDRISFQHPSKKHDADMQVMMEKLQLLQPMLKKELLHGDMFQQKTEAKTFNEKIAEANFIQNGAPVLWFYCGFKNGLYFNLPGFLEHPQNYDPRKRPWYLGAINLTPYDNVYWGTPYIDALSKRMTISASVPIFRNGKSCGVLAIDNMLLYLSRFMKSHGNTDIFLMEKVIADENGKILLSTRENYTILDEQNSNLYDSSKFFEAKEVFPLIRIRKNGTLTIRTENKRNIIFVFYKINTHNWYYVEKIDLDMLIAHLEEEKIKKKKENLM